MSTNNCSYLPCGHLSDALLVRTCDRLNTTAADRKYFMQILDTQTHNGRGRYPCLRTPIIFQERGPNRIFQPLFRAPSGVIYQTLPLLDKSWTWGLLNLRRGQKHDSPHPTNPQSSLSCYWIQKVFSFLLLGSPRLRVWVPVLRSSLWTVLNLVLRTVVFEFGWG